MSKDINFCGKNLTHGMIAWAVVVIIELVILGIAVNNLIADPSSTGDRAFIGSAFCVFLVAFISLRKEWTAKNNQLVRLKMITRSYRLEWALVLLVSLGYCAKFVYDYIKDPGIIDGKFIGLVIFVLLFILSLLGLILGWKKKEVINLDGWKYKTYCKNKYLFLMSTGFVDGLLVMVGLIILGYSAGWFAFSRFQTDGYLDLILVFVVFIVVLAAVNYRKYRFFDTRKNKLEL